MIFPFNIFTDDYARVRGTVSPFESLALALASLHPDIALKIKNILTVALAKTLGYERAFETLINNLFKEMASWPWTTLLGRDNLVIVVKAVPFLFICDLKRAHEICQIPFIGLSKCACRMCVAVKSSALAAFESNKLEDSDNPIHWGVPENANHYQEIISMMFEFNCFVDTPFEPLHLLDIGITEALWEVTLANIPPELREKIKLA